MPITSGSGLFKTSYKADMALFGSPFLIFWGIVLFAGLFFLPFLISDYYLHITNLIALASIGALSLNMLTGYTGLISLGHAGFLAVGAFTTAALAKQLGVPFVIVLPASIVMGALAGLLAGLPALRLRAVYVILSTIAMQFIIVLVATDFETRTGHVGGIPISPPSIGPLAFDSPKKWYFLIMGVTLIVSIFCINLLRTKIGRAWMAIRDRDIVAWALGVHIGYYKVLAFMFSSAVASLAGSLSSYYLGFATTTEFTIWLSMFYLAMIIVGGLGSIMGSFLGAILITLLPYVLSDAFRTIGVSPALQGRIFAVQYAILGFIISLFLVLEPDGIVGIWRKWVRPYFELWPFKFRKTISTTK